MFYDECSLQLSQDPHFKLNPFAPDTASQLNVFGHVGTPLHAYCTQVAVLKDTYQVSFTGLL